MLRPPPTSTLFPYTTLFRSKPAEAEEKTMRIIKTLTLAALFAASTTTAAMAQDALGDWIGKVQTPAAELTITLDRKSTRLNSSHSSISYAVFCLKKKKNNKK